MAYYTGGSSSSVQSSTPSNQTTTPTVKAPSYTTSTGVSIPSVITPDFVSKETKQNDTSIGSQFTKDTSTAKTTKGTYTAPSVSMNEETTINNNFEAFKNAQANKQKTTNLVTNILKAISTIGGAITGGGAIATALNKLIDKANRGQFTDVDLDNLTTEEKKQILQAYNDKSVKAYIMEQDNNKPISNSNNSNIFVNMEQGGMPKNEEVGNSADMVQTPSSQYEDLYADYKGGIDTYSGDAKRNVSDYKKSVDTATQSYNDAINENVKKYSDSVKGATQTAKKNISDTLSTTSKAKQSAINQFTGDEAYNRANALAEEQAKRQANIQAQQSANAARTAMRNAGQASNAAAILAGQGVANTYNETYADTFLKQQGVALDTGYQSLQATQELNNTILQTTVNNENKALDVLTNAAQLEMSNLNAAELTALNNKISEAENVLRQNQAILDQQIEYKGKLITMRQTLDEVARLQRQFEIAMEQYNAEQDASKKAQLFTNLTNIGNALSSLLGIFMGNKNETGNEYTEEGVHLVGESGPELVKLPEGAKIIPNSATEEILRDENPKEALKDFEENHHLKDKRDFCWCTYNSISDMSDKLSDYLKKHQKKDWGKLKENGSIEGNICDKIKALDKVFKN